MVSVAEIGPETLRAWLDEQRPEVLLRLAHRMAARMLPFADPDVWGYPSEGEGGVETRQRCTLSAIRSNLLLQVLSRDVGLVPVDRLEAAIRVAEQACLNFGDMFDENLGEALAIPIAGIVGAAVLRNPSSYYADLDGSGSVFVTGGVSGSVADALTRASPDGRAGRNALLRDDLEWWAIIRSDAEAALSGEAMALEQSRPQEAAWAKARAAWSARGSAWDFWIGWYEAILSGKALDWAFLDKVALIPNEVWERDAEVVAAEIAQIEKDPSYIVSEKSQISAELLMKASLAKFHFDELCCLMKMVPFAEDLRLLRDKAALQRFLTSTDMLRLKLETLAAALEAEGRAMQGAGTAAIYLKAFLDEISRARQLEELNIGWLVDCGEILQAYALSAEVKAEFGPIHAAFKNGVESILDLTTTYFAQTFLRFAPLKDIRSHAETSLFELMEDLRRGLQAIGKTEADQVVPLAPEDRAVLAALLDNVERTIRAEFMAQAPETRSSLRRDADFRLAQITVSLMLYLEQGTNAAKKAERFLQIVGTIDRGVGGLEKLHKLLKDYLP